jgi:hypothetical protein
VKQILTPVKNPKYIKISSYGWLSRMILLDRRSLLLKMFLSSSTTTTTTTTSHSNHCIEESSFSVVPPLHADNALVKEWVGCICSCTPNEFRDSIQRSEGRFLYRGAEDIPSNNNDGRAQAAVKSQIQQRLQSIQSSRKNGHCSRSQILAYIQNPEPDLLLPQTYNDNPLALSYFQCLEQRLSSSSSSTLTSISGNNNNNQNNNNIVLARPSNGHIGTSDPREAGKWGDVVSIWPLGDTISYVWLEDRETFLGGDVEEATTTVPTNRRRGDPRKEQKLLSITSLCRDDELVINQKLVDALVRPREVLFTTTITTTTTGETDEGPPAPFLSIPMEYDSILRNELKKLNYGLL